VVGSSVLNAELATHLGKEVLGQRLRPLAGVAVVAFAAHDPWPIRDLGEEAGRGPIVEPTISPSLARPGQPQSLAGAGHPDVAEAPLLREIAALLHRLAVRQRVFLDTYEEDVVELEALR
jgi:hypothetical protein